MATSQFILFHSAATWRIAMLSRGAITWFEIPKSPDPIDGNSLLVKLLADQGFVGQPVMLAIESQPCLSARVSLQSLPRGDRKALLYRLEEKLPLAIESVVADFISFDSPSTSGEGALVICTQLDSVRPIVESLENVGIPVRSITPAALAAAQFDAGTDESIGTKILLLDEPDGISTLTLRDNRLIDWALLPASAEAVILHLEFLSTEFDFVGEASKVKMISSGAHRALVARIEEILETKVTTSLRTQSEGAARVCAAALLGTRRLWIDFRRDALAVTDRLRNYRVSINIALAACVLVLIMATLSFWIRGSRYERVASSGQTQMTSLFREHFPDWVVPMNIRAAVEAEYRKAAAITGGTAVNESRGQSASYGSAFVTFRDVVAEFPSDSGISIDRMSFQDESFELSGKLQSYEQVDAIAAAARKSGMDVPTPQARRDSSGAWAFVVQGSRTNRATAEVGER